MATTFFMDGCESNNNEAVKYFDSIYFPIQDIIEYDNQFQESMQQMLIASDQVNEEEDTLVDEEEYLTSINQIEEAYTNLSQYVNKSNSEIQDIKIYKNEAKLQRSALALIQAYKKIIETDFAEIIEILKQENPSQESNARFNILLKESNSILNQKLQEFYDIASDYGDRYNIDLEYDEG
jgi:hypothetical protein